MKERGAGKRLSEGVWCSLPHQSTSHSSLPSCNPLTQHRPTWPPLPLPPPSPTCSPNSFCRSLHWPDTAPLPMPVTPPSLSSSSPYSPTLLHQLLSKVFILPPSLPPSPLLPCPPIISRLPAPSFFNPPPQSLPLTHLLHQLLLKVLVLPPPSFPLPFRPRIQSSLPLPPTCQTSSTVLVPPPTCSTSSSARPRTAPSSNPPSSLSPYPLPSHPFLLPRSLPCPPVPPPSPTCSTSSF